MFLRLRVPCVPLRVLHSWSTAPSVTSTYSPFLTANTWGNQSICAGLPGDGLDSLFDDAKPASAHRGFAAHARVARATSVEAYRWLHGRIREGGLTALRCDARQLAGRVADRVKESATATADGALQKTREFAERLMPFEVKGGTDLYMPSFVVSLVVTVRDRPRN